MIKGQQEVTGKHLSDAATFTSYTPICTKRRLKCELGKPQPIEAAGTKKNSMESSFNSSGEPQNLEAAVISKFNRFDKANCKAQIECFSSQALRLKVTTSADQDPKP